jgi:hypothetical protein
MPKISYTKVESIFGETLRKMLVDRLSELAYIVTLMRNSNANVPEKEKGLILKRFQSQLKAIKAKDPLLYQQLELQPEEEARLFANLNALTSEDWGRINILGERIEHIKQTFWGKGTEGDQSKNEVQVEKERAKSINKRFNIREGWLPLQ